MLISPVFFSIFPPPLGVSLGNFLAARLSSVVLLATSVSTRLKCVWTLTSPWVCGASYFGLPSIPPPWPRASPPTTDNIFWGFYCPLAVYLVSYLVARLSSVALLATPSTPAPGGPMNSSKPPVFTGPCLWVVLHLFYIYARISPMT